MWYNAATTHRASDKQSLSGTVRCTHLEGDGGEAAEAGELGEVDADRQGAGDEEEEEGHGAPLVAKHPGVAHVAVQHGAHQHQGPRLRWQQWGAAVEMGRLHKQGLV